MNTPLEPMKVLLTGATGMVGSWAAKVLLRRGASVVALVLDADPESELIRSGDIHRVTVVNGCLEKYGDVERAVNVHEVDAVLHFGAQTLVQVAMRNPLPTFEANIRGTYNLLEACRIHKRRVRRNVVASSDKAYGESPTLPYTEETPLRGSAPYDVSKSCADLLSRSYFHAYGLPVAIARCGNIFGGGDLNWSRIVPGTILSLLKGERPAIRSDGKFLRDYMFVRDAVDGYLTLLDRGEETSVAGQAFNFGPGKPVSVIDIVQLIGKLVGRTDLTPDITNVTKGEIREQWLDSSKARAVLQWTPKHSLEEGLRETIQWYRDGYAARQDPLSPTVGRSRPQTRDIRTSPPTR